MKPKLGTLARVALRDIWQTEVGDFTPWLAREENLHILGDAIGMDLEVEEQEKSVGIFRADILCRSVQDGSWVLIENQLERTDHNHLGQLLTYTAGLDAVAIVWVAERFTDEHRAALDWLNEKTADGIGFFGLEIELWRIDDSPVAPKFNVVCRPNEWTKAVVQSRSDPELAQFCADYWLGVLEDLKPLGIINEHVQPYRKSTMSFPVGWQNFWLKAYFSRRKDIADLATIWVSCHGPHWSANYDSLYESREAIEKSFGESLTWKVHANQGTCSHELRGCDASNREDWPRQHSLLASKLAALHQAVEPFVLTLDEARDV